MNWNTRYATDKMGPDTFYAGGGLLKAGPKTYPVVRSYGEKSDRARRFLSQLRGGIVNFPNGHSVSVSWMANEDGEHSTRVNATHHFPAGKEVKDHVLRNRPARDIIPGSDSLGGSAMWDNLDHHQVNDLMEHVKGL